MPSRQPFGEILEFFARAVRETRTRLRWSQRALAQRSGVAQSRISRIERAALPSLRLAEVDHLLGAMGARYRLELDPPWVDRPRQADVVHARCCAHVARRLSFLGWVVAREVEIDGGRSRGWIDVLAYHEPSRRLLVIEVKTEIHDIGRIERSLNWYAREAPLAARRLGWRPSTVGSALLVLDTTANGATLRTNSELMRVGFPSRARALRAVVEGTAPIDGERHLALIDPRSRRSAWLRPTVLEGRHSPAPYRDYIDAVRMIESAGSGRDKRSSTGSPGASARPTG